jgi:hypothetical protein
MGEKNISMAQSVGHGIAKHYKCSGEYCAVSIDVQVCEINSMFVKPDCGG